MCPSDGDGGPDLDIFLVHGPLEQPRRKMAIWIHGNDLLLVVPLRERSNAGSGLGVGEIGLVCDVEVLASDSKRVVDRIRASVSSNCCIKSVKSLQNGYCCHYEHTITSTDSVIMP